MTREYKEKFVKITKHNKKIVIMAPTMQPTSQAIKMSQLPSTNSRQSGADHRPGTASGSFVYSNGKKDVSILRAMIYHKIFLFSSSILLLSSSVLSSLDV